MSIAEAHAILCAPGQPYEMKEIEIRGVPTRVWVRAPAHLRQVLEACRRFGSKTFIVYEAERVSFEAFHRAAAALAHRLAAAGIGKGDRVAILMSNRPEWAIAFMAAVALGAIATALNAWWTGEELAYGLADSGARLLIGDAERLARVLPIRDKLPALEHIVSADEPVAARGVESLPSWIGPPSQWPSLPDRALPAAALQPEDDATLFYTSGTTGSPKGALGTHRNVASSLVALNLSGDRLRLRGGRMPTSSYEPSSLLVVPFFHVTGCIARLLASLYGGTKLVLIRKWQVDEAIALMQREQVTNTGGVPTVALQILERVESGGVALPSLQSLSFGGAPAPPDIVRRIATLLPGVGAGVGYGMTETSSIVTRHQGEEYAEAPESCGVVLPSCDAKVVGTDGAALPPGEAGELWCKGPNIVKGYWKKPEATADTFRNGWVRTGDLATLDADGRVVILDRLKDIVIRGGENIYSIEVENVLEAYPGVLEAAVVGMPHRMLGEVPAAILAVQGRGFDLDALKAYALKRLARFKVPEHFLVGEERLPRNPNGKLIKAELKALCRKQSWWPKG
jgi:acyl-CoA synthetase (AMP-forming)/AMP-acid ligase II